jgi:hypothetical protein
MLCGVSRHVILNLYLVENRDYLDNMTSCALVEQLGDVSFVAQAWLKLKASPNRGACCDGYGWIGY